MSFRHQASPDFESRKKKRVFGPIFGTRTRESGEVKGIGKRLLATKPQVNLGLWISHPNDLPISSVTSYQGFPLGSGS